MTDKPNLTRVWAKTAPGGNVVDPDTVTAGKFAAGWQAEVPPFEYFNFIQKQVTEGLAHINEQGIAVWDDVTPYPVGGLAKGSDGNVYRALVSQSDNDPVTDDGTNWDKELTKADLISEDAGKGAALVSMQGGPSVEVAVLDRVIRVTSISALIDITEVEGRQYSVRSYHSNYNMGGGIFFYNPGALKSSHDGGDIIDSSKTFPADWSVLSDVQAWFTPNATGSGCYIRVSADTSKPITNFGGHPDYDLSPVLVAILASFPSIIGTISFPSDNFFMNSSVNLGNTYISLIGTDPMASRIRAGAAMDNMFTSTNGAGAGRRLIEKLYFDCDKKANTALDLREDRYDIIQNNNLVNFIDSGLIISKWAMRVENNNFVGNDASLPNTVAFTNTCVLANSQISQGTGALNDSTLRGNIFQRCNIGVEAGGEMLNILHNEFDICNSAGVYSYSAINIQNNYFERCGTSDNAQILSDGFIAYYNNNLELRGPIVCSERNASTTSFSNNLLIVQGNRFELSGGVSALSLSDVTNGSVKNNICGITSTTKSESFVRLFGEGTGFFDRTAALEIEGAMHENSASLKTVFNKLVSIDDSDFNSSSAKISGFLTNLTIKPIKAGTTYFSQILVNDFNKFTGNSGALTAASDDISTEWDSDGITSLVGEISVDLVKHSHLKGQYVNFRLSVEALVNDGYSKITVNDVIDTVDSASYDLIFSAAGQVKTYRSVVFYIPENADEWGIKFTAGSGGDTFRFSEFSIYSAAIDYRETPIGLRV